MAVPPKTTAPKLAVALIDLRSAYNVGNIARTAYAFGFERLFTVGTTPPLTRKEVAKTALGGEAIAQTVCASFADLIAATRAYQLVALETGSATSSELTQWQPANTQPILILLGNERFGLTPAQLASGAQIISIAQPNPAIHSLNVSNAFSIAAHWLTECYHTGRT